MSEVEYLTTKQVAKLLHTTEDALRVQRYRREGPPWLRFGQKILYPRAELDKYLKQLLISP